MSAWDELAGKVSTLMATAIETDGHREYMAQDAYSDFHDEWDCVQLARLALAGRSLADAIEAQHDAENGGADADVVSARMDAVAYALAAFDALSSEPLK